MTAKTLRKPAAAKAAPRLRVGETLAVQAARECRVIVNALANTRDRHGAIHRARKSIRHLRAILALGREPFGEALPPIDRKLRGMARSLSRLRDAHVVVATARALADAHRADDAKAWSRVSDRLHERSEALLADALQRDPAFAARRARIHALARTIAALPWHTLKRKVARRALARSERKMAAARERASRRSTAKRLHRWRRLLRSVRLQRQALLSIDPALVPSRGPKQEGSRKLKRRIDVLGVRQDRVVLNQLLAKVTEADERPKLRAQLREAMAGVAI